MALSTAHASIVLAAQGSVSDLTITIHCTHEILGDGDPGPDTDGCCWHLLFQNPVIVKGYPIPARTDDERGLDIPMDLMAALGDAYYLTDFEKIPVLKGYSTLFVATELNTSSMSWHFLWNETGDRISYLKALEYHVCNQESPVLEPHISTITRNFLGWTSSVKRLAGKSELCNRNKNTECIS